MSHYIQSQEQLFKLLSQNMQEPDCGCTLKPPIKFRLLCLIGLGLSVYAMYVEVQAEKNADYVALCDISEKVSCTAVFTSPYGKGFGLLQYFVGENSAKWLPPNGVFGIAFYLFVLCVTFYHTYTLACIQLGLCIAANILSVYLAYLLYFVLGNFCVVCGAIYVINYLCLVESFNMLQERRCFDINNPDKAQALRDDMLKKSGISNELLKETEDLKAVWQSEKITSQQANEKRTSNKANVKTKSRSKKAD